MSWRKDGRPFLAYQRIEIFDLNNNTFDRLLNDLEPVAGKKWSKPNLVFNDGTFFDNNRHHPYKKNFDIIVKYFLSRREEVNP